MKNLKKNAKGYGYNYTDLAEINRYLESVNCDYIQRIAVEDGNDYVETLRCIEGEWEKDWIRGSRVIQATLSGKNNPAQEQGSGLTYARRYSLLMAFGLATTDDDGQIFDNTKDSTKNEEDKLIIETQEKAIRDVIKNHSIKAEKVQKMLVELGHTKLNELKQSEYMDFYKELTNEK